MLSAVPRDGTFAGHAQCALAGDLFFRAPFPHRFPSVRVSVLRIRWERAMICTVSSDNPPQFRAFYGSQT